MKLSTVETPDKSQTNNGMIITRQYCTTRDALLISLLETSHQLLSFKYRARTYNPRTRFWHIVYECNLDDDNKINAILSENTHDYIPQERPWWRFWE